LTADNASNNGTLIQSLADHINNQDIRDATSNMVDPAQSMIRCLAHIIHLAVMDGLVALRAVQKADIQADDDLPDLVPMSLADAEENGGDGPEKNMTDTEVMSESKSLDTSLPVTKVVTLLNSVSYLAHSVPLLVSDPAHQQDCPFLAPMLQGLVQCYQTILHQSGILRSTAVGTFA
jgi:hypothetical protein